MIEILSDFGKPLSFIIILSAGLTLSTLAVLYECRLILKQKIKEFWLSVRRCWMRMRTGIGYWVLLHYED